MFRWLGLEPSFDSQGNQRRTPAHKECSDFLHNFQHQSLSFSAVEQDRLQTKRDKASFLVAATWGLEGSPRGLLQGQLDSQLPASDPHTCGHEAAFPINPTLSTKLQFQEFLSDRWSGSRPEEESLFLNPASFVCLKLVTLASL